MFFLGILPFPLGPEDNMFGKSLVSQSLIIEIRSFFLVSVHWLMFCSWFWHLVHDYMFLTAVAQALPSLGLHCQHWSEVGFCEFEVRDI